MVRIAFGPCAPRFVSFPRQVIGEVYVIAFYRRNQQRSLESMQTTLDSESKTRQEAVRMKKKMEGDLNDLEIQLGHVTRQASEAQKSAKSSQAHIKVSAVTERLICQYGVHSVKLLWQDLELQVDEAKRHAEDVQEQLAVVDRRENLLKAEIEELRSATDQAERGRKLAENELLENAERCNLLHTQNTALINQKRKLEGELQTMQNEVEECVQEQRNAEDKAKKAITDVRI